MSVLDLHSGTTVDVDQFTAKEYNDMIDYISEEIAVFLMKARAGVKDNTYQGYNQSVIDRENLLILSSVCNEIKFSYINRS